MPPVAGTVKSRLIQLFHAIRRDRNTTLLESGVQVTTMLLGPERTDGSGTRSEVNVIRLAVPPPAGIT